MEMILQNHLEFWTRTIHIILRAVDTAAVNDVEAGVVVVVVQEVATEVWAFRETRAKTV